LQPKLQPNNRNPHRELAGVLFDHGRYSEAIPVFRKAIELGDGDFYWTQSNLGKALVQNGQFHEGLKALRHGLIEPAGDPFDDELYDEIRCVKEFSRLDTELKAFVTGARQPADWNESLALARLCALQCRQQYVAAARFYENAFEHQKQRAVVKWWDIYHAAWAATLAGTGQGKDAGTLGAQDRVRLREQARMWLHHLVIDWRSTLVNDPTRLYRVLKDPGLHGARDPAALANLPEAERVRWQELWREFVALLDEAVNRQRQLHILPS
jgi:tetratricopeptide (TPR) repeat protein